ncbi:acetate--CoA ligase [Deinococcus humi]|uniref:Acetyl-coenzyme A synthetase n=1 Tax=Deinococcus humi TaxID=662880 RepID=A0A7W8NG42_9DEIO|nr:acetate--CoA ligase [Deinococcus humi]MBB5365071.1 acetyl-CoA synthetase [Deinococcus humi]GGO39482.1 acetyl-coenzyme A synthetase [Deinococcus humi]
MPHPTSSDHIDNMLHETRVIQPPADFVAGAHVTREEYERRYRQSLDDPDTFWSGVAGELSWMTPWETVLDWQEPHARWFVGGQTNIAYNALDRQVERGLGSKRAFIWEGEDGEVRTFTYAELLGQVKRAANTLLDLGVQTGDRVTLYLPLIPEAAIAMLACARIGAVHSVVFGGFSVSALSDRINDADSKVLVTADAGLRRGGLVNLKGNADEAADRTPGLKHMLVVNRAGSNPPMQEGRDVWWHEALAAASDEHEATPLDSEHPLFVLYTSGSTGKPKGVLHTTGGYMVGTYLTTGTVFDLKDDDVFWCTADVGWVTGHSYSVYGPLLNGATVVLYEGAPNHPDWGRFWDIVQKHRVTILYTAPTAIRALMRQGDAIPAKYDLSSLRLLGSVGEPINPEAWMWYARVIGGNRCPVIDTWWQTETGSIMLTTLPGAHPAKPGSAGLPMYGIEPAIMTRSGEELGPDDGGLLVIKRPWPSMLRTVYGDDERYRKSYWGEIEGVYFAGDGARRDADGYITVMGRVDDVLNVSGHRLGTMEIESALVAHPSVAEAAVVGRPDDIKGECVVAFVLPQGEQTVDPAELRAYVAREIGALARPDAIYIADALPKTRSGKIMRRFLRQIAAGKAIEGDTSTLEDPGVLERLAETAAV